MEVKKTWAVKGIRAGRHPLVVVQGLDGSILTQDTGENTNPRRYEVENAFRSQVAVSTDGAAHILWGTGTTPARISGKSTTIYTIMVYNHSGADRTVVLEIEGEEICPKISIATGDTIIIDLPTPIPAGDNNVDYHASGADLDIQIIGLEV